MTFISFIGLIAMVNINTYPLCNDDYTNSKLQLFNDKKSDFCYNTLAVFIVINGQLLLTILLYIFKRRKILRNSNDIINSQLQSHSISQSQSQMPSNVNTLTQYEAPLISQYSKND